MLGSVLFFVIMSWFRNGPSKKVLLISAIGTVYGGMYLLRDSFRGKEFEKDVRCDGKVAIVTGGNSGIGKETARELAKRGAIVYILCRDKKKCDDARKAIVLSTKNKYVYSRQCDLASLESIRDFVKQFLKEEDRLDILINNAGVYAAPKGKTKDGFETHLGVNHLGHFYLTNLLIDILKKSAPSRIINVTSGIYIKGKIKKEDLNSDKEYNKIDAYNQSKLANVLFTIELAKRLEGTGVTVNVVNPGAAGTSLYRNINSAFASIWTGPFSFLFLKTAIGAAQTSLKVALDPDLEKVTGTYFDNCLKKEILPPGNDKSTAEWLWLVSEKWTKLTETRIGGVQEVSSS